jgi:hypothetical protein
MSIPSSGLHHPRLFLSVLRLVRSVMMWRSSLAVTQGNTSRVKIQ